MTAAPLVPRVTLDKLVLASAQTRGCMGTELSTLMMHHCSVDICPLLLHVFDLHPQVYELVQSSNGAAAEQGDAGPSATLAAPTGPADVAGPPDSPPAGSARHPRAGRAFAISPSGYVSMLPSRRTSVAQPAAGVSMAPEGQAAAALIKRKSRLASLFELSPVDAAAGSAAVAAGKEDKGRVSRLVRLFGSKGSSVRSSTELADQQYAEQDYAPCRDDYSSPQAKPDNQHQQEQGQQQQEWERIQQQQSQQQQQQQQSPNHVRMGGRRVTLAVLAEVAERLQEGSSCQHTSLHDMGNSATPPAPQELQQQERDTCSAGTQDSCSVAFTGLTQLNEQQEECGHVTVLQPLDAEHQASPQAQLLLSVVQEAAMAVVAARHQAANRD